MTLPLGDPGELATPAGTARILRAFAIRPRKRLGQHFLVSRRVLQRLLAEADLRPGELALEVGAGLGTLTVALAATGAAVVAVEVDERLIPVLRAATAGCQAVRIVHGDIMALDPVALTLGHPAVKLVANLPYQIASPLLVRCLETLPALTRAVVTVQAEVAERIQASPGSPAYGALSVAVQFRARARRVLRVPPGAFLPPPQVHSAVLRLDVLPAPRVRVRDAALFFAVVRAAFGQRRKMLRRALAAAWPTAAAELPEICARAGIDPQRRGETLTLAEFAALTDALAEALRHNGEGRGSGSPPPGGRS
ncbi:MAG: 16S rRNA (adenine(1518)-N(6)/adenine(1519)-N(6))-dimethyltransferase RsmA [Armatimonadota bacterium]|nr:16S rRNA (adenine(1518)-N(6)/adenine(1519)-N(6))-dimethyltransferase RsmA [Armatimonadota bacterium]MDR7426215.1 16S rRNA (adenine(1518)-N(6)/adenine(1519)-N(6))-dimethyltransferase RsmA [Armatimonadota bacterium]MDR7465578.1 16S rRNA (adenine(1518)-N(6)/adenine(1519)-N(6))-dimethyltransferase RsmA [Armatimonadota bacterium]MDR7469008.1 16S rRNA (adenine(1518)-N(6)/adenine(1519)-N(6))-dimethyltransferase RsmA [Armatimonadota bacterium]MDR7474055.1 16S rRNA (adenine(1518)-N(6)/adenine(1519)-N